MIAYNTISQWQEVSDSQVLANIQAFTRLQLHRLPAKKNTLFLPAPFDAMIMASSDGSCFLLQLQVLFPLMHIRENNFIESFKTDSARRSYLKPENVGKQKGSTIHQKPISAASPVFNMLRSTKFLQPTTESSHGPLSQDKLTTNDLSSAITH